MANHFTPVFLRNTCRFVILHPNYYAYSERDAKRIGRTAQATTSPPLYYVWTGSVVRLEDIRGGEKADDLLYGYTVLVMPGTPEFHPTVIEGPCELDHVPAPREGQSR